MYLFNLTKKDLEVLESTRKMDLVLSVDTWASALLSVLIQAYIKEHIPWLANTSITDIPEIYY